MAEDMGAYMARIQSMKAAEESNVHSGQAVGESGGQGMSGPIGGSIENVLGGHQSIAFGLEGHGLDELTNRMKDAAFMAKSITETVDSMEIVNPCKGIGQHMSQLEMKPHSGQSLGMPTTAQHLNLGHAGIESGRF